MSAFEKIIGYETVKEELMQVVDMFHNKEKYEKMGAKLINGILICGARGVGKTTLAKNFIKECGVTGYVIDKSADLYKFAEDFSDFFEEVKKNAPAIVFIDDLDDISEEIHNLLQTEFDNIDDSEVLVIASANDMEKIPNSLFRAGRFDRKIPVCLPNLKERRQLFEHYLKGKKTDNINLEDISMMSSDCSCADIKSIVNEAAIISAYSERKEICMSDFVQAFLKREYMTYDTPTENPEEDIQKTALHEAGHLVITEVLCPDSVAIVSIRTDDGFTWRHKELPRRIYDVIVSLGGKAAVELYYAQTCASGCQADINRAFRNIRQAMNESGTLGIGMLDVSSFGIDMSENMNARNEAVVHAEMEKCLFKARDILLKNRAFLEKAVELLLEKRTLLHSDIKALKKSVTITDVAI